MHVLPKQIIDRVSIKNVKENFGHDLGGFFCDIHFDKKKVGYFNNDGWGGIPDVNLYSFDKVDKDRMMSFENFLTEQNFAQFIANDYNSGTLLINRKWEAKDFNFESQVEFLCERLNFLKMIEKKQKKAILFGNPRGGSYTEVAFKIDIETIKKNHLGTLRAKILEIKNKLNKDECIFNTNLQELL
jgi:hypothetical protein